MRLRSDVRAAVDAARDRVDPFGRQVVEYDVIGSTNDEAVRLANVGAAEGTVVIADEQTGGRGRSGGGWFSPPGVGLYFSVVLRPGTTADPVSAPPAARWSRLITLAAGVAVAEGIRAATGLPVEIKWPNDVMVGDGSGSRLADRRWRKLAGILTEASATAEGIQHVVVGIGINVGTARYPAEMAGRATSLEAEAGRPIDRGAVLVETLAALSARYKDLRAGRGRVVLARWRDLSPAAAGARITFFRNSDVIEGVTAGVDEDGALRVRTARGVEALVSGEVTWT